MSPRSVLLALILTVVTIAGCRRAVPKLDDVPRIAYGSKPAVVRISAYATATFRYPMSAVTAIAEDVGVDARKLSSAQGAMATGAGGSGSGFIIRSDGFILTSGHVIAPTRSDEALERELRKNGAIAALVQHFPVADLRALHRDRLLDQLVDRLGRAGQIDKKRVVNEVELSDGSTIPFQVVKYSPSLPEGGADLALIRVDQKNLPSLPLGDSSTARVGDTIWTIGYPAVASSTDEVIGGWLSRASDLEATFNVGTISAIKRDASNRDVLQSTVAIYRGNSGGPAIDRNGHVIGIATWGHSEVDQIKFLVPSTVARSFLEGTGVRPELDGEFNRYYRAALEAAGRGDWTDARRQLDIAARLFPGSPDVTRFSGDVDRALREASWWQLHPVAAIFIAVATLGFMGIGGVAMMRARYARQIDPFSAAVETVLPTARDESGAVAPQMLGKFTILNGTRAGQRLGLGGTGIRIGRERAICEIVLENPKISRLHAEVVSMDGKVLLIDRNSSNGTYVNDQKIDRRFLKDGDIIYFGGRNAIAVAFHV